jgi:hypothetical protein
MFLAGAAANNSVPYVEELEGELGARRQIMEVLAA